MANRLGPDARAAPAEDMRIALHIRRQRERVAKAREKLLDEQRVLAALIEKYPHHDYENIETRRG